MDQSACCSPAWSADGAIMQGRPRVHRDLVPEGQPHLLRAQLGHPRCQVGAPPRHGHQVLQGDQGLGLGL